MLYSDIYRSMEIRLEIVGHLRGITFVSMGTTLSLPAMLVAVDSLPAFLPAGKIIRGLSVGLPPDGGPMQFLPEDGSIYLILDCGGKGNTVMGLAQVSYEMPVSGSHDIDAGVTTIFKAKDGDVFLVKRLGGELNMVLFVYESVVYKCKLPLVEKMFKALGRELPFTFTDGKIVSEEWRELKPYHNSLDF